MKFFSSRGHQLVIMLSSFLAASAFSQDLGNGWAPSPLEIMRTPDYCQKQFLSKHDGAVMEKLFINCPRFNHFCPALILINRTSEQTIPKQERKRIAARARTEIDYTLSQLTPACNRWSDVQTANTHLRTMEMLLK